MGIIYEDRLEKDAKLISFYAREEKATLENICNRLINISTCYSSTNSNNYTKIVEKMKDNIQAIHEKRIRYANILYNEIIKYKELSAETSRIFDEEGRKL